MPERFVSVAVRDGIAILTLQRSPVNAIEIESARQLADAAINIESLDDVRAVVLCGSNGFFSAGLDLKVVPQYDRAKQQTMIRELARAVQALYGSRKPVIAAVNGHAVAAGTLFALCCDYRIGATGESRFGLTGVRVGIPYPIAALAVIRAELGVAGSRLSLLGGHTFDAETALQRGILDELVASDRVIPRAVEVAADRARVPARHYGDLKAQLRRTALMHIRQSIEGDPTMDRWIEDA